MISSQDIYQRYVSERRTREIEGFRIECFPKLVRYTALRPNLDGFVTFANLSTAEADRFIEEQIGYFDTIGQHFEWKIYDFDEPAQLRAMLQARDFVNGQEEAFMVMPLPLTGAVMPGAGPDIRVQRIQDPIALRDVVSVQEQVW